MSQALLLTSAIFRKGLRPNGASKVSVALDGSCATRIHDESLFFSWQAQYFVMLEGDSRCSTHRTGSQSFFVAGAILRGVGGCTDCYFVARSTTE